MACRHFLPAALAWVALTSGCASGGGDASQLAGQWTLNRDRTLEVQPDDPTRNDVLGGLPRASVRVGGIPLPVPGGGQLPSGSGSPQDPKVLHTPSLTITPADDRLTLTYAGAETETLERGDDQGLISDWSTDRLTTRYETTSRQVRQKYEVQADGSLLVTVELDPNQGSTLIHKRVFDRADTASP